MGEKKLYMMRGQCDSSIFAQKQTFSRGREENSLCVRQTVIRSALSPCQMAFLSPLMTAGVNGRKGETETWLLWKGNSVAQAQSLCGATSMCNMWPLNTEHVAENVKMSPWEGVSTYVCIITTIKTGISELKLMWWGRKQVWELTGTFTFWSFS